MPTVPKSENRKIGVSSHHQEPVFEGEMIKFTKMLSSLGKKYPPYATVKDWIASFK